MNKERLLKVADFLDKLPTYKFFFGTFVEIGENPMLEALAAKDTACGTTACAIGWCPAIFPNEVEWKGSTARGISNIEFPSGYNNFVGAATFFGISYRDCEYLFNPGGYCPGLGLASDFRRNSLNEESSAKEVADHIREFVKNESY